MRDRSMGDLVKDQRPLALPPETSVAEACAAMRARRVGAVLVVEDHRLAGIFTGRDALRCLAEAVDAKATTLAQVMTANPTTMPPHHGAMEALRVLDDGGFRHLPICDGGRVVGIVSRYDFRAREHARLDEESGFFEHMR